MLCARRPAACAAALIFTDRFAQNRVGGAPRAGMRSRQKLVDSEGARVIKYINNNAADPQPFSRVIVL